MLLETMNVLGTFEQEVADWVSRAWLIENYQRGSVRFKYLGQTKAGNIQGKRGVLRGVAGRRRSAHCGMLQPTVDLPLVNPLVLSYRKITLLGIVDSSLAMT
jgi:hypothetical protein